MNDRRFLLDSNVIVWLDQNRARIPEAVLEQIEQATEVFLSAVTAWELAIKQSLGALSLRKPVSEFCLQGLMTELPVTIRHGEAVRNLPMHHRDPFDRLLVAQAQVEGLVLITGDKKLTQYEVPILLI